MKKYNNLFGKKLIVCTYFKRQAQTIGNKSFKVWTEKDLTTPKEVLIIGVRRLQNGGIEYEEEVGIIFTRNAKEDTKALLVVENASRKPFYVPYEKYAKQFEVVEAAKLF